MANLRFKVGDRVSREADLEIRNSPLKHGEVIRAYSKFNTRFGDYPELYSVRWDDGTVENGFLPHGLDHDRRG